jgi:hypothetical protein
VAYREMEYYLILRKNENLTLAMTRMNLDNIVLSEKRQKPEDKYCKY